VFFDSDCIIPEKYFEIVSRRLEQNPVDAYGGPDMAHPDFTAIQKSINYSMTSFFTTGGIRGGMKDEKKFHPRSFNMGFSKQVFEKTKGFSKMRFGEDVDMSLRIIENNFSTTLIKDAAVYHKRRVDFKKFFKQVFNSGIARINLYQRHPKSLKLVHFLPAAFTVGLLFLLIVSVFSWLFLIPLFLFIVLIFIDSLRMNKNLKVALLSVVASFVQLTAYGMGFIKSFYKRLILRQGEFHAYQKNFYK
jgi:GT2 family glycosyltransferase